MARASSVRCRAFSPPWCGISPTVRRSTSTWPAPAWRPTCGACSPTRARTRATSTFTTSPPTMPGAATTVRSSFSAHRTARGLARRSWTGSTTPGAASTLPTISTTSSPRASARSSGLPVYYPGIVMEGGSIDVNGRGTLLTTEACLLNPNRNPQLDRAQIEEYLRGFLGVEQDPLAGRRDRGDDTDGHVDDLTRFVNPTTVVTVVEDDPADENYEPLQENLERLSADDGPERSPAHRGVTADAAAHCTTRASACRPAMRTSTSPTAWSCFRPTIPSATLRRGPHCNACFRTAKSSGSTAPIWSGASALSTA